MTKVFLLTAVLVGGSIVAVRLMPAERRERLSQRRERMMEQMRERMSSMIESMPEDSPPKVIMTGIRRMQEQNEELLALLREQNDLLRERLPVERAPSRAGRRARETADPSSD